MPTLIYLEGLDWMKQANLTMPVLLDTFERLSHETGAPMIEVERVFWRVLRWYERAYGMQLYLTGQVFAEEDAELEKFGGKEFWEDLLEDVLAGTKHDLGGSPEAQ